MNRYPFKCSKCGEEFDVSIAMSDYPRVKKTVLHCGKVAEPVMVGGLGAKVARNLQYPYENISLPHKYGPNGEVIRPIVQSQKHEDDICAGAWNGEEWRRNQI